MLFSEDGAFTDHTLHTRRHRWTLRSTVKASTVWNGAVKQRHRLTSTSRRWSASDADRGDVAHKSQRHSYLPPRVRATKAGLTLLAGELSRALALREALIRLDGDVWTVHRGGQPDKADCHSALAAPGSARLRFSPKERWSPPYLAS